MVRYGALFLLISFIFAGCQSEESFSGKVGGINHGLSVGSKKLSVTVFQWEGGGINLIKSVELIMVELPEIKQREEQMRIPRKIMSFLGNEYDYKVTAKFVAPEKEGPTPGFLYHNKEDIAIALLKQGYLKVDKNSEFADDYPEKFQKYLKAESTTKESK